MPFSLIIILAPRIAYLNDDDDILVPRYNPVDEVTAGLTGGSGGGGAIEGNTASNGSGAAKHPPAGQMYDEVPNPESTKEGGGRSRANSSALPPPPSTETSVLPSSSSIPSSSASQPASTDAARSIPAGSAPSSANGRAVIAVSRSTAPSPSAVPRESTEGVAARGSGSSPLVGATDSSAEHAAHTSASGMIEKNDEKTVKGSVTTIRRDSATGAASISSSNSGSNLASMFTKPSTGGEKAVKKSESRRSSFDDKPPLATKVNGASSTAGASGPGGSRSTSTETVPTLPAAPPIKKRSDSITSTDSTLQSMMESTDEKVKASISTIKKEGEIPRVNSGTSLTSMFNPPVVQNEAKDAREKSKEHKGSSHSSSLGGDKAATSMHSPAPPPTPTKASVEGAFEVIGNAKAITSEAEKDEREKDREKADKEKAEKDKKVEKEKVEKENEKEKEQTEDEGLDTKSVSAGQLHKLETKPTSDHSTLKSSEREARDEASSMSMSINGILVDSAPTTGVGEMVELNIKQYILEELDNMHKEDYLSTRPTIVQDETGNSIQAMCVCERVDVDIIIARLAYYGVGNIVGSVNVLNLEAAKFYKPEKKEPGPLEEMSEADVARMAQSEEEKKLLMEVASQLRVEQVVEQIETSATLTFDYLCLLTIASTIAGLGLATGGTVSIVASMLVSPIMGPVMALTFGGTIKNYELMKLGLISELLSLSICVVIGFIIGLCAVFIGTDGLWPTDEMASRGVLNNLAIGLAIAVPSGMGVALSILGNNTSSLVGVAISASLLPPAVNCGMAFAYATIGFMFDSDASNHGPFASERSYINMGGVSLALTLVNIGAIYCSGVFMFRLKEVAPIKNKTAFWARDTAAFRSKQQEMNAAAAVEEEPEVDGGGRSGRTGTGTGSNVSAAGETEMMIDTTMDTAVSSSNPVIDEIALLKEVGRNRNFRKQLMKQYAMQNNTGFVGPVGVGISLPAAGNAWQAAAMGHSGPLNAAHTAGSVQEETPSTLAQYEKANKLMDLFSRNQYMAGGGGMAGGYSPAPRASPTRRTNPNELIAARDQLHHVPSTRPHSIAFNTPESHQTRMMSSSLSEMPTGGGLSLHQPGSSMATVGREARGGFSPTRRRLDWGDSHTTGETLDEVKKRIKKNVVKPRGKSR